MSRWLHDLSDSEHTSRDPRSHRLRTTDVRDDLTTMSDAALMLAVARYRDDALAEIYRRHAGAVFGLSRRLLGAGTAAEDVVQEVFVRLWNQPDRFDSERGSLRSFLLSNTHSRAVDMLRSDGARRNREERDARRTVEAGYDLEHEVWDMAMAAQVRSAVGRLTDGERDAIELAYFGGHSYRQVATLLGEAEGTVKSRIRTGLKRLRLDLNDVLVGER